MDECELREFRLLDDLIRNGLSGTARAEWPNDLLAIIPEDVYMRGMIWRIKSALLGEYANGEKIDPAIVKVVTERIRLCDLAANGNVWATYLVGDIDIKQLARAVVAEEAYWQSEEGVWEHVADIVCNTIKARREGRPDARENSSGK